MRPVARLVAVALAVFVAFVGTGQAALLPVDDPAMTLVGNLPNAPRTYGQGLWLDDGYAYLGSVWRFSVIDVHDPTDPFLVAAFDDRARDVDVLHVDGRTVVGTADGGPRIRFYDATEPTETFHAATVELGGTSHNLVALPGTSLFYNSRAFELGIDIIDVSVPEAPVVVKVWNDGYTCHDITAYPEAGRAYCAGMDATYVMDITDPIEPVTLVEIRNEEMAVHHWAIPTPDHRTLAIGDERIGFPSGCEGSVTTPVGTVSERTGAVWFYDLSVLDTLGVGAPPVLRGWVSLPPQQEGLCSSHFGDMIEDTGLLAVAWYAGGVILIDYDDPGLPRIVDQFVVPDSYAWDARYSEGHLFVGDQFRGLDVLRLDLPGDVSVSVRGDPLSAASLTPSSAPSAR